MAEKFSFQLVLEDLDYHKGSVSELFSNTDPDPVPTSLSDPDPTRTPGSGSTHPWYWVA